MDQTLATLRLEVQPKFLKRRVGGCQL